MAARVRYRKAIAFHTKVVGVTQRGRQKLIRKLRPGQPLILVPEPTNPADPNAIQVCLPGRFLRRRKQIGFLSADIAEEFSDNRIDVRRVKAFATERTGGQGFLFWRKHYGLNIYLTEQEGP